MISIIIPTKNEPLINELINEVGRRVKQRHEIIVVDKSEVPPRLERGKLVRQKSNGLGNAFIEGVEQARGDIIVLMDGDFSHNPKYIKRLIDGLKDSDLVIGSRFVKGGRNFDIWYRKAISAVFTWFASTFLDVPIKDSMSGFGAVRREVLDRIDLKPLGYKILLEIAYKSKKLGYRISEIPIRFQKRRGGKPKANINEAVRTLRLIFGLKLGLR